MSYNLIRVRLILKEKPNHGATEKTLRNSVSQRLRGELIGVTMTVQEQYSRWQETTLKNSRDKFKE